MIAAAVTGLILVGIVAGAFVQLRGTAPRPALGPPRFVDETESSGVRHTYDGEYPFSVGGGLAVLDCDDDGRPDLFIAGGKGPAALYRNVSAVGGALAFVPVQDPVVELSGVLGAYPLDVDGDGHLDLMVLRDGENVALRGLGGCRFEPANGRGGSMAATA